MNPVRTLFLAAGLAVAVTLGAVATVVSPAAAQTAIKVVVNGEPITTNEIAQRARFLRLVAKDLSAPQLTKQATEELIEEKLKQQEAKRVRIQANEAQVEAAFAGIATRVKLTPAQLAQALGQQGVEVGTLKTRIRSQIIWQQLVLSRFQRSVTISDAQIVAALEKQKADNVAKGKAEEPARATTAEYALQQVTMVVPKGTPGGGQSRMKEAEGFRAKATGCEGLVEIARGYKEVVVKNVGKRTEDELPQQFRGTIAETPVGKLSKPVVTPVGVEMLAVCSKRELQADLMVRSKVEDSLREKEGALMARQYISELRRIAVIIVK
jgi:peptidyl-prolyl cis-trans isomerase SurA